MVGVAYAGYDFAGPTLARGGELTRLNAQNAALNGRLGQAQLELAVERASHAELERQVTELQAEVNDLNQQLEFLTVRSTAR